MNRDKNPLLSKPSIQDMKKAGVYSISSEDKSIRYVGSAINFSNRLAGHKLDCKRGKGNRHLMSYIIENGWSSIIFTILEFVEDIDILKDRENYWINYYGFENLINMSPDAKSLLGTKMPDSHRQKSSERMKGNKCSVGYKHKKEKGEKCALYWETHPEEKALMIERNRESQKKIDRTKWNKGHIIEVTLDGKVVDKCYGVKDLRSRHQLGYVMCSKLLTGKRESYNGYSLKYIGKFFVTNNINREEYF